MTLTALVTGSGGPLGVNLTRSLRLAREPLRLVGMDANRWHLPLSICDATYLVPFARDRAQYARAIAAMCERESIDVIVPTHPVEVRAIAELRDVGALGDVGTAIPTLSTLDVADDKAATQKVLLAAGVPVPRTIAIGDEADLERAFAELRGGDDDPVWVRGAGAPGLGIGGAALPCRDAGVARAWIEHHDGYGRMAASEYLPGRNLTWMGLYDRGRLVASAMRERLEYVLPHVSPSGITGAPAVSRTIADDAVADIGRRAVSALDPAAHGAFFVDLKGDAADAPRVTEINAGRCGTTVHFYTCAGLNFPELLVYLAAGRGDLVPSEPLPALAPELYWVRTLDCGPELVRGDAGFDGYPVAP